MSIFSLCLFVFFFGAIMIVVILIIGTVFIDIWKLLVL